MNVPEALQGVAEMYGGNLAAHGAGPRSVGWRDEATQRLRFDKLAALLDPPPAEPVAVSDLGCGYGAMFDHLAERLGPRLGRYWGYDISPAMLGAARARVGDPRARFLEGSSLVHACDYAFASGIFNVKLEADDAAWREHVLATLDGMHQAARRGFAFNLLSTYVDWREPHLYYADPALFLDHCKRRYGGRVALLHDYPLYEWTLLVRKDA